MRRQPLRAVVLALAAAAGTGIALAVRAPTGSPQAVTRTSTTTTVAHTTTRRTTTAPPPATTTAPVTIPARTTTTATVPPRRIIPWPGGSGWTDILVSLPATAGRADADDAANGAIRAGLKNVGVLFSSRYPTLHAGYWVVFFGAYGTQAGAQAALVTARGAGFAAAYPRFVSPR